MQHRGFPKIAGPGEHPGAAPPGGPWVALEKVHGAQMVIAVDGEGVHFGKRKAWLRHDEPFFGWQLLRAPLTIAAHAARARLAVDTVVLYGELYGGAYPHPDVPAVPGLAPVQTGIWYAPDLRYAVFDVLVASGAQDEGEFLAHREVVALAREIGLDSPPVLHSGPRSACLMVPVRQPTRVPLARGLPELAGNLAEGVVLKPDARARPSTRIVYKQKIAEFDEQRFAEAEAWDADQRLDLPALLAHARRMLERFSGRTHQVLTAVAVHDGSTFKEILSTSDVTFRPLTAAEITAYIASGEPRDKAGAYGIQGRAAIFISHLAGSFTGGVGLPLAETWQLLREFDQGSH